MFVKYGSKLTKSQINTISANLFTKGWSFKDVISPHMGKQVYVTVESLLDTSKRFMSGKTIWCGFNIGDPLHWGYSLALCNPISSIEELGNDGYDNYHAPILNENGEPFLRRMWISGQFKFSKENDLKYGEPVGFKEIVTSVKHLQKLDTIVCEYKRSFSNSNGLAVVETRKFGYISGKYNNKPSANFNTGPIDKFTMVKPTIISSFRASAICFNSHLIHYDSSYIKNEGYPKVVVEAPLLILLSLQHFGKFNQDIKVKNFDYKITSPVFIDDEIRICYTEIINEKRDKKWSIWIDHGNETPICLYGTLEAY